MYKERIGFYIIWVNKKSDKISCILFIYLDCFDDKTAFAEFGFGSVSELLLLSEEE
jgi:hypothetical protein